MELCQFILNHHTPNSWSSTAIPYDEYRLISLGSYTSEYQEVERKVKSTLSVEVTDVRRVENPFLWGCYQLKKAEYEARQISFTEKEFFHCTSPGNISSIAKNNLDWRRAVRVKYGMGVSFSPSAQYANKEANINIGQSRATILAKVIVGQSCYGSSCTLIPRSGYDTSTDGSNVYVKYQDNEFYPSYVAYYDSPPIVRGRRRYYF